MSLQGAFVTKGCNPREGLSVIFNSDDRNGFSTLDGIKQYSNRWLHGVPPELYEDTKERWLLSRAYTRPTARCGPLLTQFAQALNQNQCVIVAQTVLPIRGVIPRGVGALPKGELRSGVNQGGDLLALHERGGIP